MRIPSSSSNGGSVLMAALLIISLVGASLLTYLTISHAEHRSTARDQVWNTALVVAEAGVEEALTQLNFQEGADLSANGWTLVGGKYTKQRTVNSEAYYVTTIDDADLTIRSTGYMRLPPEPVYISRTIEATVDTANSIFTQAVIAKKHIKFRRKKGADSYDGGALGRGKGNNGNGNSGSGSGSSGSSGSGGKGGSKGKGKKGPGVGSSNGSQRGYDKNNPKDNFGLACPIGKKDCIKVEESKIHGNCEVAPSGSVKVNKNGSVGSTDWVKNTLGMDPSRLGQNFRFTFAEVEPPVSSGKIPDGPLKIDGVDYQYVLGSDTYELGKVDLKKPMLITGDAVLLVTDSFKGDKDVDIVFQTTNSTLKLYVAGDHLHLKPKNTLNLGVPASFQIYGLNKNKCVKIETDTDVAAVIYTPRARIHIKGKGDFYGSVVGKCVHASGDSMMHYDEALGRLYGDFEQFVITGWKEL